MKILAAIALLMAVVGCGTQTTDALPSAEPTVPVTQAQEPSAVSSMDVPSPLEGSWRSEAVALPDMEETLRTAGLHEWLQPFRALPDDEIPHGSNVFILTIQDGRWDLDRIRDGGTANPIDYGHAYEIDGDTVTVNLGEGRFNRYRWTVEGDVLRLEWLETNLGPYRGIPEEVMQRAIYMSAPFERQP